MTRRFLTIALAVASLFIAPQAFAKNKPKPTTATHKHKNKKHKTKKAVASNTAPQLARGDQAA